MTTNNETTEADSVSSTAGPGQGAINLSSRPSSVPETATNQGQAVSGNSAAHTPNIVEADSQEEQTVGGFFSHTFSITYLIKAGDFLGADVQSG